MIYCLIYLQSEFHLSKKYHILWKTFFEPKNFSWTLIDQQPPVDWAPIPPSNIRENLYRSIRALLWPTLRVQSSRLAHLALEFLIIDLLPSCSPRSYHNRNRTAERCRKQKGKQNNRCHGPPVNDETEGRYNRSSEMECFCRRRRLLMRARYQGKPAGSSSLCRTLRIE